MTELMARPDSGDRDDSIGRQTKVGLHGHPLQNNMARAAIAEAIGTFVLVLTIVTTVIAAGLSKSIAGPQYGSLAIPVAGGVSLALVVASIGHVSGAHLNPAVTLGLAVNKRFPWTYVPVYLAAQLGGAVGAALVAWALYGDKARTLLSLGATYPGTGEPLWRALFAEVIVTFLLVLVVISVATDRRVAAGVAAIAIGAALAAAILMGGRWRRPRSISTRPKSESLTSRKSYSGSVPDKVRGSSTYSCPMPQLALP
jgi:glycerol uptake facilitator-like aquaporin